MTDHYLEAEKLLTLAGTHTDTGDERDAQLAALFTARAQVHATLALATRRTERPEPAEPEAVPLWRAAETWGDDIEVRSVQYPSVLWRVRGGEFFPAGGGKGLDLTKRSVALVTLVSREPYRDDPWAPGADVTALLVAGETPPEGTILTDRFGYLHRAEADGTFASRTGKRWSRTRGSRWANDLSGYAPVRVATPLELTVSGINTQPATGPESESESCRDERTPWTPGTDVTALLAAGETVPEGTILADCDGDLYRVEAGGAVAQWWRSRECWKLHSTWEWEPGDLSRLSNYAPIHVATPEQIRAAGIEVTT